MIELIVNADDFGQSEDTVVATIECFESGALTSATVMTARPATDRAIEYALQHPEHSFGVHLTFVRDPVERPLCDPERVPSLVGADGCLLSTRDMRVRALAHRVDVGEIELELEAQLRAVAERGVVVSHVDSHRHLHKLAPFRAALERVLPRFGITRVRTAQDVFLADARRRPTYWLHGYWGARLGRAFVTSDHFFMAAKSDPPWAEQLAARIHDLRGSLEIGVHPGREEPWRDRDRRAVAELVPSLEGEVSLVNWRTLGTR